MSGNHSDSDDFGDDLIIMASQGLLDSSHCTVVLSPILGTSYSDGCHNKTQFKNPVSQCTSNTTAAKRKLSLSRSQQTTSSTPKPMGSKSCASNVRFGNKKTSREKSPCLNVSKSFFSSMRTNKEKSNKLKTPLQDRNKRLKKKSSGAKKGVAKRKNFLSLEKFDSDSSDLEDPSIIMKKLSSESLNINTKTIDEILSDDDILNEKDIDIPAMDSSLPLAYNFFLQSGPRHSSSIKSKIKKRKIFDAIRKENEMIKSSQNSVVVSDSDPEIDYSQSFVKCSQDFNKKKVMKSVPKRPRLSLKTATAPIPTRAAFNPSPDLGTLNRSFERMIPNSQSDDNCNDYTKKADSMLSDDLFSSDSNTEILETQPSPMVERRMGSKKPYDLMGSSESTIPYGVRNDDDTQPYSLPNDVENVLTDIHKKTISWQNADCGKSNTGSDEENPFPALSKTTTLTMKATCLPEEEAIERDSPSFLTEERSSSPVSIPMPTLSPEMSFSHRHNLSPDISIPQLSQYVSDVPKNGVLEKNRSIPTTHPKNEGSSAACCSYSLEEDVVPVFDSEDEELFMTQSAIDRTNQSPELFVKEEDISEEELDMSQENKLWWDNKTSGKLLRSAETVGERLVATKKCKQSASSKNLENEITQEDCIETTDTELVGKTQGADDVSLHETDDQEMSEEDEPILDDEGNEYFSIKLNIYHEPTPDDFKHVLYPEDVPNVKDKRLNKRRSELIDNNRNAKQNSVGVHLKELSDATSGQALSLPTSSDTGSKNINGSSVAKNKQKRIDDSFSITTQVCEEKGESGNVGEGAYLAKTVVSDKKTTDKVKEEENILDGDDVDDDVYLAQTQIDYWVINSEEECDDEGRPEIDFEEDIDLLDLDSNCGKVEMNNDVDDNDKDVSDGDEEVGDGPDIYTMATQIGGPESSEEAEENVQLGAESNSQVYMMATLVDKTLPTMTESDLDDDSEIDNNDEGSTDIDMDTGEASPLANRGEDADDMDPYLMDTQIDSPEETEETNPYVVNTQIDTEECDDQDVYEKTLEMNLPCLETRDSIPIDSDSTKSKEVVSKSEKLTLKDKPKADVGSAQKVHRVSSISKDAGVTENNVVEYMLSTQIDTTSTAKSKSRSTIRCAKTLNVPKVPTVTKSLFERLSEASGIQSSSKDVLQKDPEKTLPAKSPKRKEEWNKAALKKTEECRKTQEIVPKWMSARSGRKEKSPNSSDARSKECSVKNVQQLGNPPKTRKRRLSKKSMEANLSSNIALAKKKVMERNTLSGAVPKHTVGKETLPKQADLSDVEMPNTQEIIEQGLPILNKVSPIAKRVVSGKPFEKDPRQVDSSYNTKSDARNLPATGFSSHQRSSSSTSSLSSTIGPRSLLPSSSPLSSSSLSSSGEGKSLKTTTPATKPFIPPPIPVSSPGDEPHLPFPTEPRQLVPGASGQEMLERKDQSSTKKLPSMSRSIYLHEDKPVDNSSILTPASINATSHLQAAGSNPDENRRQMQNNVSSRKIAPLPKSAHVHSYHTSNSVCKNAPQSPLLPPPPPLLPLPPPPPPLSHSSSTGKVVSLALAIPSSRPMAIATSNNQPSVSIHSSQSPLPPASSTPVSLMSIDINSEMEDQASNMPRNNTPASAANPSSGSVNISTSISVTTNIWGVSTNSVPMSTTVTLSANPTVSISPRTINTSLGPTNNTSTSAESSTKSSASAAPRQYGAFVQKPKQLRKGILKTGQGSQKRVKSRKVHFNEARNLVKLIEKVEARPLLQPSIDSTTKKINREPFRSPNRFFQIVLKWNPSWVVEQVSDMLKGQPPPVTEPNHKVSRMRMSYDDVKSYQEINYQLFLLEVWAMLSNDWNFYPRFLPSFIKSKPQYVSKAHEDLGLLTMEIEGVTNDPQTIPVVSDILVLAMQGRVKDQETTQSFEQFGFVEAVRKNRFEHSKHSILCRPEIRRNFEEFLKPGAWVFSVSIRVRFKGCVPFDLMKIRKICSLTTALRQFQGLVEFAQIPLCPALINPDPLNPVFCQDDYLVPDENLLKYLNKEQANAVTQIREAVLRYPNHPRVCLLQGPPGTGKSFAIMVLVHQILLNTRFQAKICLAAPSNAAVDEMASRLFDLSEKKCKPRNSPAISLVRLGNIDSVSNEIKKFHISSLTEERLRQDQQKKLPKSLQEELKAVDSRISSLITDLKNTHICDAEKVTKKKELERLRSQDKKRIEEEMKPCYEDRRRAKYDVINDCHVVCGTLSSFGSGEIMPLLRFRNANRDRRDPFTCLIVDEATQAVEMDCLIPLQHHISKLVLVGDQEQLPATVLSQEAKNCRYDRSLFQRLHDKFESCKEQCDTPVMMLKEQYRMHPEILKLPNSYFYRNLLTTASSCIQSRVSVLSPYLVFDILDGMECSGSSGSKSNKKEATCVALLCQHVVNSLNKKHTSPQRQKKIGVICPYTDQKKAIQDSLRKLDLYNIVVNTVDGFQGQEKDIIILSCVRAQGNPQSVGFVDDSKRMNVSLTRAKLALYIVGHGKTLGTSDLWKLLYQDAKDRGFLVTVPRTVSFAEIALRRVPLPKPKGMT